MVQPLKKLISRAEAVNASASRIALAIDGLIAERDAIVAGLVELGIKVTEARRMVPRIECAIEVPKDEDETAPDAGQAEDESQEAAE
jgi:hypothetical protein